MDIPLYIYVIDYILGIVMYTLIMLILSSLSKRQVCFIVDNLSTMLEKIYNLGAIKLGEITKFESGLCVYCKEPAGSFFEMEELKK